MLLSFAGLLFAAASCTASLHVNAENARDAANQLSVRVDGDGTSTNPGDFGGQVSWTLMTSKDGTTSGRDANGIWYVKTAIEKFLNDVEQAKRNVVFWTGGVFTQADFDNIDEFIKDQLGGNGVRVQNIFKDEDFKSMGLDWAKENNLLWRAVNRLCKALAAGATNGKAYVYMKSTNCRTIFSPPSQKPQDADPDHDGQATNGEIFHYAELPMLMRNSNIQQIITFYKEDGKFTTNVAWDVTRDTDKPRNFLPDTAMDATPIILPPGSGRPPLKRSLLRGW